MFGKNKQKGDTYMKTGELWIGILVGGIMLTGLGYLISQFNSLNGRVCALEAQQRANLEERVAALETKIAVMKALSNRVDTLTEKVEALSGASGRILSPTTGQPVSSHFEYEIELQNPVENRFYYIVNRIEGLYWPKVRIHPRNEETHYAGKTNEGGKPPDGRFSMVLFEVDSRMHHRISNWLNGTDFPGIQIDGRELDSVELQLRP
jgi:hypothetical protein